MYRDTQVIETFAGLTEEEFEGSREWFNHNAVDYLFQEQERWFKLMNPTPAQVASFTDAIENGFTPPTSEEG